MDEKKAEAAVTRGWTFLTLWFVLIVAGIIGKRVYGHPDLVPFFHLPAAVFLILGWHALSRKVRERYQSAVRPYAERASGARAETLASKSQRSPR